MQCHTSGVHLLVIRRHTIQDSWAGAQQHWLLHHMRRRVRPTRSRICSYKSPLDTHKHCNLHNQDTSKSPVAIRKAPILDHLAVCGLKKLLELRARYWKNQHVLFEKPTMTAKLHVRREEVSKVKARWDSSKSDTQNLLPGVQGIPPRAQSHRINISRRSNCWAASLICISDTMLHSRCWQARIIMHLIWNVYAMFGMMVSKTWIHKLLSQSHSHTN